MTQAFLIVIRVLAVALFLHGAVHLWRGTQSRTTRVVGLLCSAILIWQAITTGWLA